MQIIRDTRPGSGLFRHSIVLSLLCLKMGTQLGGCQTPQSHRGGGEADETQGVNKIFGTFNFTSTRM